MAFDSPNSALLDEAILSQRDIDLSLSLLKQGSTFDRMKTGDYYLAAFEMRSFELMQALLDRGIDPKDSPLSNNLALREVLRADANPKILKFLLENSTVMVESVAYEALTNTRVPDEILSVILENKRLEQKDFPFLINVAADWAQAEAVEMMIAAGSVIESMNALNEAIEYFGSEETAERKAQKQDLKNIYARWTQKLMAKIPADIDGYSIEQLIQRRTSTASVLDVLRAQEKLPLVFHDKKPLTFLEDLYKRVPKPERKKYDMDLILDRVKVREATKKCMAPSLKRRNVSPR